MTYLIQLLRGLDETMCAKLLVYPLTHGKDSTKGTILMSNL